jgi:hypothetical protein
MLRAPLSIARAARISPAFTRLTPRLATTSTTRLLTQFRTMKTLTEAIKEDHDEVSRPTRLSPELAYSFTPESIDVRVLHCLQEGPHRRRPRDRREVLAPASVGDRTTCRRRGARRVSAHGGEDGRQG